MNGVNAPAKIRGDGPIFQQAAPTPNILSATSEARTKQWLLSGLGIIVAIGIGLRLFLPAGFTGTGFDEHLYSTYLLLLDKVGLLHYPSLADAFLSNQLNPKHIAILPPTRVFYIVGGYLYHQIFGLDPQVALRTLSCHCSILALVLSAIFCLRLAGPSMWTLAVTALVACAPTQIHLGQHALIDGVFGFWALLVIWLLWENLQHHKSVAWRIGYGVALAFLVMTKENASFVFAAVGGLLLLNHWLKFGTVTRSLLLTTFVGAIVGFVVVVGAAGGFENFALIFALLTEKVPVLPYTIATGGGPWHRYLIDLMLVSPIIMILALANLFSTPGQRMPGHTYLAAFSFCLYGLLTCFPGGMNLRYILVLDMPIRFFAGSQLFVLSQRWGRYRNVLVACVVVALCAYELRQHYVLFRAGALYELVTADLMRAQRILQ